MENTNFVAKLEEMVRDHLHIRGEYTVFRYQYVEDRGSPPHTWRIPVVSSVMSTIDGITSTYVENTETNYSIYR